MGTDFYQDDYGGGGYYDGGGYGYGAPDLFMTSDIGAGSDFNYGYGFDQGLPPDYAPGFGPSSDDTYNAFLDYYLDAGFDYASASNLAELEASQGSIEIPTIEQGPLPEASLPTIPLTSFYDYWQSPPYIPTFGEGEYFPLPPPPSDVHLPPACPGGQYHPYPIGHPQQDACVPFPQATTNQPQRSPGQQPSSGQQAPKPPAQQKPPQQQQCPSGYYRAANGQCLPIPRCTTPGTMFDQATGRCVPQGQAVSPLPSEAEDLLSNLKDVPWWVWLALGGAFLLSRGEERTTTVRYRRAS